MGVVLQFEPRAKRPTAHAGAAQVSNTTDVEQVLTAAVRAGLDQQAILAAAGPLLAVCRDRYGFTVMQDGLPRSPGALADALVALLRGLTLVESNLGGKRPFPGFGVYFGRASLEWFEDGCGGHSGLAVPDRCEPGKLAEFVRARLARVRA